MALYLIENTPGDAKRAYGPFDTPQEAAAFLQFVREGEYIVAKGVKRTVTQVTKTLNVTVDEALP